MFKLQLIGAGVRSICIFLDKFQSVVRAAKNREMARFTSFGMDF